MDEKEFGKYLGKRVNVFFQDGRYEDDRKIFVVKDGYRMENSKSPNDYEIIIPEEIKKIEKIPGLLF